MEKEHKTSKSMSVFFPAYNEGATIQSTIEDAARFLSSTSYDWDIVIVNDGSKDATKEKIENVIKKNSRVNLIDHPKNLGYARVVKTCFEKNKSDILFIIDSDGQQTLDDIPKFVEKINQGYDLVVGWKKNRKDPLYRVILSKGYNLIFSLLFKLRLHDVDCGFRALTKESASKINITHYGVPVGPEIFARANTLGYKIAEVPVIHYPRKEGKSIFKLLKIPIVMYMVFASLLKLKLELKKRK